MNENVVRNTLLIDWAAHAPFNSTYASVSEDRNVIKGKKAIVTMEHNEPEGTVGESDRCDKNDIDTHT